MGVINALEVAWKMGLPAFYVEMEGGQKKLRRGAPVRKVIELVRNSGGEPVGVGVLIDRSERDPDFGCPLHAAHRVEATTYAPDEVPDWLSETPISKPGTR